MNIHIVPHGKDTNHIKKGLRAYNAVDKVYLLTSEKFLDNSYKLKEQLIDFGYEVEIRQINAFELRSVVDTITDIARRHKNDRLYINITGGTNLMAGAATSTAFFIGATAYYVMEGNNNKDPVSTQVKELPIPTQPLYVEIKGKKRDILEALNKMDGKESLKSMQELCKNLNEYPQKISFHIADLEKKKLIKTHKEGRVIKIEISPVGRLYLQWTT